MQETMPTWPRTRLPADALPPKVREMSERAKIIWFGVARERPRSPWRELSGMFHAGKPVSVENMLAAGAIDECLSDL